MNLNTELSKLTVHAMEAYRRRPSAQARAAACELLKQPALPATLVLLCARRLLGNDFLDWEPETIWRELDDTGCMSALSRDKLMAAVTLARHPQFYWDCRVFGNTALAFGDEAVFPELMPRPTPGQLAWATFEAELIFALTDGSELPDFHEEVGAYTATVLFDEGFVSCPGRLAYCEEELTHLLCADCVPLKKEVDAAWRAYPKKDAITLDTCFDDTPLGVQLARQAEVHLFLLDRVAACNAILARL